MHNTIRALPHLLIGQLSWNESETKNLQGAEVFCKDKKSWNENETKKIQVAEVFCRCTPNLCQGVHRLSATRWNIAIFVFVTILVHISTLVLVFTLILLFALLLLLHILFVLLFYLPSSLFHLTHNPFLRPYSWRWRWPHPQAQPPMQHETERTRLLAHPPLLLPVHPLLFVHWEVRIHHYYLDAASTFISSFPGDVWMGRETPPPPKKSSDWKYKLNPRLLHPDLDCRDQLYHFLWSSLTRPDQWSISVRAPKHTHTNTKHTYSSIMKLNRSENMDLRFFICSARSSYATMHHFM